MRSSPAVRLRRLLLLDIALLIASIPGLLNVVAKDHVSTTEGVIAWISLVVLVVSLVGLLALLAVALRRAFARPS